jgi:hypothetical protein
MPAAAVPLAAAAVSAAGSIYGANKQAGAARDAANAQNQLSAQQMAQAQAERDYWKSQLSPLISSYQQFGNQDVISPDLTAAQYDFFNKDLGLQQGIDTTRLSQELQNRGLGASGIFGRAMADQSAQYAKARLGEGLRLANTAATTNYNAKNAARQYLMSLMMSGYGQGQAGVQQSAQLGAGLQSDAIAAQLAASGNRYNAIAGGLGSLAGAFGNYYQNQMYQRMMNPYYMNMAYPAGGGTYGGTIYSTPIGPTPDGGNIAGGG